MRLLRVLTLIGLYGAGVVLIGHLLLAKAASDFAAGKGRTIVLSNQVPPEFPVLLVWQNKGVYRAKIVSHLRLSNEVTSRDCSFLVPAGEVDALRREVAAEGSLEVHTLADGRQALRVMHTWHGGLNHESSWYFADRKGITPRYYLHYMEGRILFITLPMLIVPYSILWAVGLILYRKRARRKHGNIR